jgi:hypothetical protein
LASVPPPKVPKFLKIDHSREKALERRSSRGERGKNEGKNGGGRRWKLRAREEINKTCKSRPKILGNFTRKNNIQHRVQNVSADNVHYQLS